MVLNDLVLRAHGKAQLPALLQGSDLLYWVDLPELLDIQQIRIFEFPEFNKLVTAATKKAFAELGAPVDSLTALGGDLGIDGEWGVRSSDVEHVDLSIIECRD